MNSPITLQQLDEALKEIDKFVEKGGKFVWQKEAENAILKVLQLKDFIDFKLGEIKQAVAIAGESVNPNFKGIIGEKINAYYRYFGEKYDYEVGNPKVDPFLYERKIVKVDSGKVDAYIKDKGDLPDGIILKQRVKTISFQPTDVGKKELEVYNQERLVGDTKDSKGNL